MRLNTDMPDLEHVETTPQEQVTRAYVDYLEARVKILERALLEVQHYCAQREARAAHAVATRTLTSL